MSKDGIKKIVLAYSGGLGPWSIIPLRTADVPPALSNPTTFQVWSRGRQRRGAPWMLQ